MSKKQKQRILNRFINRGLKKFYAVESLLVFDTLRCECNRLSFWQKIKFVLGKYRLTGELENDKIKV